MLSNAQQAAFDRFYDSARHNDVLDSRTTLLIHMAAAMATSCDP